MQHCSPKTVLTVFIFLIFTSLACANTLPAATPPATTYRYDNLPNAGEEDETISKYQAISQWGKTNINYYFIKQLIFAFV